SGELSDPSLHTPPRDAPRFSATLPALPAAPPSHSVHKSSWIHFTYHPSVRARVQPLIDEASAIRAELSARLGQPVLDHVIVHVGRTPGEMAALAPQGAPYPKYAAGVAYPQLGLVLLTIAPVHPNSSHDLREVFKHELAHIALNDALLGRPVPRWFNEGFAVFASGESSFARWQSLWTATLSDNLLPLARLERGFPADDVTASVAYAEAVDVVRFLVRRQDEERFAALVERIRDGQSFERALEDAYGTTLASLEFEWREEVARRYTFWPVFFSGSMIWAAALGLFVWGWRRRRKRNRETLARWEREEAEEDARKRRIESVSPRVHIVIARSAQRSSEPRRPAISEVEIPKVEHEGQWHTLH
ncbi:MAG TPA: peptidase MA family metallohydrolase, partial [Polyangiaceae bacterium]|nr:peptidase MA family metallohydrolase [Polyangiaceae bacterium]